MFRLLRYYALVSSVAIAVATVVLVAIYRHNATNELIATAESQNVALARSLANTLWPRYSSYVKSVSGADGDMLRARPETRNLHELLAALTAGVPVLKVKIYSLDGLTVYSSEPSQIGADKSENPGFRAAAEEGRPASKLSFRDTFSAFSGVVSNRDLVESYLPIRGGDGVIEGVFELYSDVSPLVERIDHTTSRLTVVLLATFGFLYGVLSLIVRHADRILRRQHAELLHSKEAIEAHNFALEERFRAVVNYSPAKIHIRDTDGRYVLVNRVAEKLFGVKDEEARGKTSDEFFSPDIAAAFAEHDRAVLKTGQVVEQEEEWPSEDGIRTYLTVNFPILNYAGEVTGIGAIGTDITDRKHAEEKLQWSEKTLHMRVAELEAAQCRLEDQEDNLFRLAEDLKIARDQAVLANRAKSEFLANMSHELRTPLTAIIGFSDLIRGQSFGPIGSPKYIEYIKDINESGTHLLALINDILDLSKIEAGKAELHEEAVDGAEAVESCLNLVKERAETAGVNLKSEIADGLPPLYADKRKLKQILINLLSNAVKFTPAGGKITIKTWSRPDDGYVFQVADTGIGIAPDDIPKALAPFQQIDSDLNRKYEGTGLGLPLTKSLVELHGGSLDLQSEVGVGTTVTVRFPAKRVVLKAKTGT